MLGSYNLTLSSTSSSNLTYGGLLIIRLYFPFILSNILLLTNSISVLFSLAFSLATFNASLDLN